MADDEAFVRAIVAAPGDDAPRLAYADWLDERGDPRGAYVRAEVKAPNRLNLLRELAHGLDTVWAARVSRPPAGVCCPHLARSSAGPGEPSEIVAQEASLGLALPQQLRALLLNYSLGHLNGGPFVLPRGPGERGIVIDGLVCLIDPEPTDGQVSYELADHTEWLRDEYGIDPEFFYLASTFYDTEFLVSGCQSDYGSVLRTNSDQIAEFGNRVEPVAASLGEFLATLQPRTWPLTDL